MSPPLPVVEIRHLEFAAAPPPDTDWALIDAFTN
jgi:hypothetical protein